ncbi:MAG: hypothetical protein HRS57_03225 [Mycoplasmataceae bacterium]|nr:hypothetical protein [Mycoplasmataceae bacterium]
MENSSPFISFLGRELTYKKYRYMSHHKWTREEYDSMIKISNDKSATSKTIILLDVFFECFLNDLIAIAKSLSKDEKVKLRYEELKK